MMRLVVLGATGLTGKEVVQQALDQGHSVTAVVRNPDKITTSHHNLQVVRADILDASALRPVMAEQDAVVSCLGFPRKPQPVTGYSESMKAVVTAMRDSNVRRLVAMTSWYTDTSIAPRLGFVVNWIVVPMLRPVLTGMREMETFLESCPDINYTIVRPPDLKKAPVTELEMTVSEDFYVDTGSPFNGTNRSDVAKFMLSCLKNNLYDQKMVAITTTPKKAAKQ